MTRPHAYAKACRIRRRRDFLSVQDHGRRRRSQNFVVIQQPGSTARSRIGITVSSRVGNAVVRNRVKRLVREVFRHVGGSTESSIDSVVIARPGAERMTYGDVARELEPLFVGRARSRG